MFKIETTGIGLMFQKNIRVHFKNYIRSLKLEIIGTLRAFRGEIPKIKSE